MSASCLLNKLGSTNKKEHMTPFRTGTANTTLKVELDPVTPSKMFSNEKIPKFSSKSKGKSKKKRNLANVHQRRTEPDYDPTNNQFLSRTHGKIELSIVGDEPASNHHFLAQLDIQEGEHETPDLPLNQ